jgi:hypothetical protein
MIEEQFIEPAPEAQASAGPPTKGARRLQNIVSLLSTELPERYGTINEKWLKDYIADENNARKIMMAAAATGRMKNMPNDVGMFREMLLDETTDEPKAKQAVEPAQEEAPVETVEQPAQEEQPAQPEQPVPTQAPEEAPVAQPALVPQEKPIAPKEPKPAKEEKAWYDFFSKPAVSKFDIQVGQTVKNLWDRFTGKQKTPLPNAAKNDIQKLQDYESSVDEFRAIDKQKESFDNNRLQGVAVGMGDPEVNAGYKAAKAKYSKAIADADPIMDKLARTAVEKAGADKLFQFNVATNHKSINAAYVQQLAKDAARAAGMPEDGPTYTMLKSKIQGIADYEVNVKPELTKRAPEIQKKVEEAYSKMIAYVDQKTKKSMPANLKEDLKKDFNKQFTAQEQIKAKAKRQVLAAGQQIKEEGSTEAKVFTDEYKKQFEGIQQKAKEDPEVSAYAAKLNNQDYESINAMYKSNQLTLDEANAMLKSPEREEALKSKLVKFTADKYAKEFSMAYDNYAKAMNELNTRKDRKYARIQDQINQGANSEIERAANEFIAKGKYKMSPQIENALRAINKKIYEAEISDIRGKENQAKYKIDEQDGIFNNIVNSTLTNLGSSIKNYGTIFGVDAMASVGEILEKNFEMAHYKNDSWLDLFNPTKFAGNTGMLLGRMAPGMALAAATTAATRGAGVGTAGQIMAATLASWSAETADMAGGMKQTMMEKYGDPVRAEKAAADVVMGQVIMIPTYTLQLLPFFSVIKGSAAKRFLKGAGLEWFSEGVLQEFPQGSMEKAIENNRRWYEAYKEMTFDSLKENIIATAPSALLGGGAPSFEAVGELTAKKIAEREARAFYAKQSFPQQVNDINISQTFQNIQATKGKNFAGALLNNLFVDGKITQEQADRLTAQLESFDKFLNFLQQQKMPAGEKMQLKRALFVLFNEYERAAQEGRIDDAEKLKKQFNDAFTGKTKPPLFIIELANNEGFFYTYEQILPILQNPDFQKTLREKNAKIGALHENDAKDENYYKINDLLNSIYTAKDDLSEEVIVSDDEYQEFVNNKKVDEARMLGFIENYLEGIDINDPKLDQRYVEMYKYFLPEIKKRAGEQSDEEAGGGAEQQITDDSVIWTDKTPGQEQEYTYGQVKAIEDELIAAGKELTVFDVQRKLKLGYNRATELLSAYQEAKKTKPVEKAEPEPAEKAEPVVETMPAVGQVVIVGGEKGVVVDEGNNKLSIQTDTKTIEIPPGQSLESVNAKVYTEPANIKSRLQQRKDAKKYKVEVLDENTALVNGEKFNINKDPKGNAIYLTNGKIEIRDENVLINVDIQRHKLEVKETPEQQQQQLQQVYPDLTPDKYQMVQDIVAQEMTERIANLLENGITDQTDEQDFLQTRLWAEDKIAVLLERQKGNPYALDMIEELQNLLNLLWYEHKQKFGKEPGKQGTGETQQENLGEEKGPESADQQRQRLIINPGDRLYDAIAENGEGVDSRTDAEKRIGDGQVLFGYNEQDDSFTEIFLENLGAFPPDMIIAVSPDVIGRGTQEADAAAGEQEQQTEWARMDAALEAAGKQGETMRADLRAEIGDENFSLMRKITKDFEKIVARLEENKKIKKECP